MKPLLACVLALLLVGPNPVVALQDPPPTILLDPADIGADWDLVEEQKIPATVDQPYVMQVAEYAGPKGERILVDLAVVEEGPEHINELAMMLADRAALFGQRADFLSQGAEATAPTDACTRGTWWQGSDPLMDDPAMVGLCSLGPGTVAIIVANGPADSILALSGQVVDVLHMAIHST